VRGLTIAATTFGPAILTAVIGLLGAKNS
jgi:hypothetical protein